MKTAAVVDDKGRLVVPLQIRRALNVHPGDAFYFRQERGVIMLTRATNPFDVLATDALADFRGGRTVPLGQEGPSSFDRDNERGALQHPAPARG